MSAAEQATPAPLLFTDSAAIKVRQLIKEEKNDALIFSFQLALLISSQP